MYSRVRLCFALFYGLAAAYPSENATGAFLVALDITFLVYLAHELLGVAVWGRTLGKWLLGLRVVVPV